jgi:hypothetical protein
MQQNNKSKWFTPIAYAVVLVIGIGIGVFFKGNLSLDGLQLNSTSPIQEIMTLVKSKYVDEIAFDSVNNKLADYYMKKINLVGAIINTVRLVHLKLNRIKNGGLCVSDNPLSPSKITIKPTLPFVLGNNTNLITIDPDIRSNILRNTKLTDERLLTNLTMIEIDNETECKENNGKWISDKQELDKYYLDANLSYSVSEEDINQLNKLENSIYSGVTALVSNLQKCIEERIEPKMIDGKEKRMRIFRDRPIVDTDLETCFLTSKKLINDIFFELDSYFLIHFMIRLKK